MMEKSLKEKRKIPKSDIHQHGLDLLFWLFDWRRTFNFEKMKKNGKYKNELKEREKKRQKEKKTIFTYQILCEGFFK